MRQRRFGPAAPLAPPDPAEPLDTPPVVADDLRVQLPVPALRQRLVERVGRAERVTGALAIGLTMLGVCGVASTGGEFLAAPTVAAGWSGTGEFGGDKILPLAHGHSHNDYERRLPLSDAIERGFTSVEVDVWQIGGRLLVGHEILDAAVGDRTLSAMYLDPLRAWVDEHDGSVLPGARTPFTLVVDVKSGARTTYQALDKVLTGYSSMLTRFTDRGVEPGAVTVVVSGNTARAQMAAQPVRWAAYDGRARDLAGSAARTPADLMPMVSAKWTEHFRWNGVGEMPAAERARLQALVAAAHAQGRLLRFYNTPAVTAAAREAVWAEEMAARVDLLNIDNLDAGKAFLLTYDDPSLPWPQKRADE